MQRRYPGQENTLRRLLTIPLGCALIPLLGRPAAGLEWHFHLAGPTYPATYLARLKSTLTLWVVAMSEYECFYFVGEKPTTSSRREAGRFPDKPTGSAIHIDAPE